ncbi:hypothetical protein J2R98_000087 [Alkalibacillus filiformis]|uniref:Staygreen protein domain-containing protein n=1 Tax=Alkalibacillus filiformis TaxID=200990 RepID=A0ABU0DPB0_9BACI|nr:staygreen family protein [Alkalibacillus filiformis]MDQ0350284.1 hypothetical protein [Alkalibacillus filiformis]
MSAFDPNKLSIQFHPPATPSTPIIGRKYTLTHSDETGELFLDIGTNYNFNAIDWQLRDEVLAEWIQTSEAQNQLLGYAYVDGGEFSLEEAAFRYNIFLKEMQLALKGIIYGDIPFYEQHQYLLNSPIVIEYHSSYPAFQTTLYYGTPRDILNEIFNS